MGLPPRLLRQMIPQQIAIKNSLPKDSEDPKTEEKPLIPQPSKRSEDEIKQIVANTQKLFKLMEASNVLTTRTADTTETNSNDTAPSAANGVFDFSVVPGYNDSLTSFYKQLSPSELGANPATSKSTIDEGYWDNALDALDTLRPQLHEYIKAELESSGREYNYDTVEKFLDYFISNSVSMALSNAGLPLEQTVDNWDKCNQPVGNKSADVKMSHIVSALLQQIDAELGKESQYTAFGFGTTAHNAPNAFTTESLNKKNNLTYNYIMSTADRYLDSDEKMLKTVLVGLTIPDEELFGETTTSTISTVEHILKLYKEQVKTYLKQEYSDLNDEDINNIFSKAMEITLNNADSMRINSTLNGANKYNLEQIIQSFSATCEELVKSDYPQAIHNEGLLFGIPDEDPEAQDIRSQAQETIKSKIPNIADSVVDQILSIVTSYGNKVNQDNFGTIIDMLVSNFMIQFPVYDENGREMKVDSMENRLLALASIPVKDEFGNDLGTALQLELTKIIDKYLENPNDAYHNEGYLFGAKGGAMFTVQVRAMAEATIKGKIPNASTQVVNKILSAIASYGNRIGQGDLDSILEIIVNTGADFSTKAFNLDLNALIDKYLDERSEKEHKGLELSGLSVHDMPTNPNSLEVNLLNLKYHDLLNQKQSDNGENEPSIADIEQIINDGIDNAWNLFNS